MRSGSPPAVEMTARYQCDRLLVPQSAAGLRKLCPTKGAST